LIDVDSTSPSTSPNYASITYKFNVSLILTNNATFKIITNNAVQMGQYLIDCGYSTACLRKDNDANKSGTIQLGEPYSDTDGIGNSKNGGILINNARDITSSGSAQIADNFKAYGSVYCQYGSYHSGEIGRQSLIFIDSEFINTEGSASLTANEGTANKLYNFTYSSSG